MLPTFAAASPRVRATATGGGISRVAGLAGVAGLTGIGLAAAVIVWRRPKLARWARLSWAVWRADGQDSQRLEALQRARLLDLVAFARVHSAYYRARYRDLPEDLSTSDLTALPIVTKPELMAHFDEWMTDPAVTRAGVDRFLADPTTVGERYLGHFAVWTTSGTTGTPGVFVHDPDAVATYTIIGLLRASRIMRLVTRQQLLRFLRHGSRNALLAVSGGHFVGASETERLRRRAPRWLASGGRLFSVLQPLPELVRALNAFQPHRVGGYPTALALLAQEQLAGRLHIHPSMVTPSGESLTPAMRARLRMAFGCPVRMAYAASEFIALGFECPAGWLHLNADWVILEPVGADYRPVPPGTRSHSVLLTNLANRAAPLIRYDLGDSVIIKPDPCPCGCRLPAMRVEGREADVLRFECDDGSVVETLPLAIGTVVEETPGVRRCQLIQTGPHELTIRLEVAGEGDERVIWDEVTRRLAGWLQEQGAAWVTLIQDPQPPRQDPASGKFRQVWTAWQAPRDTSGTATHANGSGMPTKA